MLAFKFKVGSLIALVSGLLSLLQALDSCAVMHIFSMIMSCT